ncbi:hypothetical protein ACFVVU_03780 [Kitasatospora sp. NPDC057965]|uniref:hypothetical protein n=1 Tax=Kitasatospora sp. NPDC057965 TaxID=3346291 RepID=UPI0036D7DBC0
MPSAWAALALAALTLTWFVRRCLRSDHPLLDLGLFKNRQFSADIIAALGTISRRIGSRAVVLQEFDQPAPAVGGLERDRGADRQIPDHPEHRLHAVGDVAVDPHRAVLVDHGDLGPLAVHVDTDVARHPGVDTMATINLVRGMGSLFKECEHPESRWPRCPHEYKIRYRNAAGRQTEESGFATQDSTQANAHHEGVLEERRGATALVGEESERSSQVLVGTGLATPDSLR